MDFSGVLRKLDAEALSLNALSDGIWEKAEISYTERESSRLLAGYLEGQGFELVSGVYGIPTAFTAQFGSGSPRIGLLGEFDALSGLSQKAEVFEKCPLGEAAANGHGCGHNLLGAAAAGAAVAVKEFLAREKRSGTVIFYGCPAEENGSGKAFMARAGAFKDLDCALTWHPGVLNRIFSESSLANVLVKFCFHGISSHAGGAPELGRSALDAVELMNVGANYLREHMIDDARVHYAVTNTGGTSPNVVQASADVVYMIRSPESAQVQELLGRVVKIAEGAALMTETTVEHRIIKSCANFISNRVLEGVLYDSFRELPLPEYSREDREYLEKFSATCPKTPEEALRAAAAQEASREGRTFLKQRLKDKLWNFIVPWDKERDDTLTRGSTDVGDVSWMCPTAQFYAATWAPGTPGHSWQVTAQGKGKVAKAAMLWSAKVLALAACNLLGRPELAGAAREEFGETMKGRTYFPVPPEARPAALAEL
ncbi:MAG: amidohydrolase [Treponema sp.]|jgi:aminobenzoyl-glutamate utilization protein B|nr:amidohydrolase [Treponema sp.]